MHYEVGFLAWTFTCTMTTESPLVKGPGRRGQGWGAVSSSLLSAEMKSSCPEQCSFIVTGKFLSGASECLPTSLSHPQDLVSSVAFMLMFCSFISKSLCDLLIKESQSDLFFARLKTITWRLTLGAKHLALYCYIGSAAGTHRSTLVLPPNEEPSCVWEPAVSDKCGRDRKALGLSAETY